ncbi:MAG: serine/threonine protein kinase [Geobacteraceae bacterium GWC2_55_20]|nr:MAG: serine/threonine protein kinase [Geobacteraceae bacterium GWC2_55_20]
MARPRSRIPLNISINGEKVGSLSFSSTGRMQLVYDPSWLASENSRPLSLSLPLGQHPLAGTAVECFFDNLLPDNDAIRRRIQARFGAASDRCFDLLWHIGRDCVGALQLLPETEEPHGVMDISAEPLTDTEIAETLRNYQTMPLGMQKDSDFRISLAGAQEKTALLRLGNRWCRPHSATPTTHIFKLPIGQTPRIDLSDSVENGWLCHRFLKEYGIPVATADICFFDDVKTLVVERFDRRWSKDGTRIIRLPMEDMCQALGVPPVFKYEEDGGPGIRGIMDLLLGSEAAAADRRLFMKTQLLFWLLGAIDGHAKNFSIYLLPRGAYRLTPLYDVMSAWPFVARKELHQKQMKMAMSVDGKNKHYFWGEIIRRHWSGMSRKARFPEEELDSIIQELADPMEDVIARVVASLPAGFPAAVVEPVVNGMRDAKARLGVHT